MQHAARRARVHGAFGSKAQKAPTASVSTSRRQEEFDRLRRERDQALEQQAATSEVLKVISSSAGELKPVFESILENAVRICEASFGNLLLYELMRSDTLLCIMRHRLGLPNSNAIRLPLVIRHGFFITLPSRSRLPRLPI
jgi:hypothetical protein